MEQIILHVDMDAFYASVEIRDDPSLRGKPLIIGAMPGERGVVATCSYEARKFGVRSAMNVQEAYRLCPNGVFMHPNMEKYRAVSGQLHRIWREYASALEAVAFDEAYLDVTEKAGDLDRAAAMGREIKERIRRELGLSCSVGVAYSKTAAKTASEEKKPDGFFVIPTPEAFVDLILDRDVRVLYTVGEMTAEKLYALGIRTVRDLRERASEVEDLLGKQGAWITRLARGIDDRPVTPYRPEDAKSIGREVTFQKDVEDFGLLKDVLLLLALCVEHRADGLGLHGKGVTLKLTYGDRKGITRSQGVENADSAAAIYRTAARLLDQVEKRPVRLVGVSIHHLSGEEMQLSLPGYFRDGTDGDAEERDRYLEVLGEKYGLDFAGHVEQLYGAETLHRTVEYMRKHTGG